MRGRTANLIILAGSAILAASPWLYLDGYTSRIAALAVSIVSIVAIITTVIIGDHERAHP